MEKPEKELGLLFQKKTLCCQQEVRPVRGELADLVWGTPQAGLPTAPATALQPGSRLPARMTPSTEAREGRKHVGIASRSEH